MTARAEIFAAVRKAARPGLFNDPGHVLALDNLLDAFGVARERTIGPKGLALIQRFEGCKLTAYPDPGSGGEPWTIGWGTTRIDGRAVRPGETITQARADALFKEQVAVYADQVSAAIGDAPTSQEQFDALVSFHYNTGAISTATLTKRHKAGDYAGAIAEFPKWNKSKGRVMSGLTRRRAEEAALYRAGSPR